MCSRIATRDFSSTSTATIAGFSGDWRKSSKFAASCSIVYCGASTSASWPSTRSRVSLSSWRSTVMAQAARLSTSTTPLRSRMRPRGDSVCTTRVARATASTLRALLGAHLEEPQAGQERAKQGDNDDADDGNPNAAVVAHGMGMKVEENSADRAVGLGVAGPANPGNASGHVREGTAPVRQPVPRISVQRWSQRCA